MPTACGFSKTRTLIEIMRKLTSKAEAYCVLLVGAIACTVWSWFSGKDLNWDQLNYHLYVAASVWNDRLLQDFFPASIQSYLNPFSYVPFYLMVINSWPDLLIGSVLALAHSLNFFLLYLICRKMWPNSDGTLSRDGFCAWLLGLASPVLWQEIGSSFNDISLTAFVLFGIYLGLNCRSMSRAFLVGIFLGTATGLKLTFGVFGIAILPLLISNNIKNTSKVMFAYGLGGIGAIVLWHGWWSWKLWSVFQNPVFPFFNKEFKSPFFLQENFSLTRFIPKDIWSALYLPIEMIEPVSWVYTETFAPDLRPLAIITLVVISIALLVKRYLSSSEIKFNITDPRIKLMAFASLNIILWMTTSANGRYGLPIALLSGAFLVSLARVIFKTSNLRHIILAIFFLLHTGHTVINTSGRWNPYEWNGSWFNLEISPELKHTPALYLSISNQSHAYLASWLHPKSSLVNLIGQYVQPNTGAPKDTLAHLVNAQRGNIYVMYESNMPARLENAEIKKSIGAHLQLYGYGFSSGQCYQATTTSTERFIKIKKLNEGSYVLFCPISVISTPLATKELQVAKRLQTVIEKTCPDIFKPNGVELSKMRNGYSAFYLGTEYYLIFANDGDIYGTQVHSSTDFSLGSSSDWLDVKSPRITCPSRKRASAWFASSWQN
jgi:Glycosyltransferase family 87